MKRLLIILIIFLALAVAGIYAFIPNRIRISKSLAIEANKEGLYRKLGNAGTWKEWWPGEQAITDSGYTYSLNETVFKPGAPKIMSIPLSITAAGLKAFSEFTFIPVNPDSSIIQTETVVPTSYNPFKRAAIYFKAKKLENNLSSVLESINNTYTIIANLYGYDIQKKLVVDSTLIFTSAEVKGYPAITTIYSQIDKLRDYIRKNSATETGFPMLNVYTSDSITYHLKVAIPVNQKMPSTDNISYKWMLGGGNILITEVKGGPQEINKAYEQISHYISDYHRIAPAIPFESLVTDRRKEPDSSKWITRIYYPVM